MARYMINISRILFSILFSSVLTTIIFSGEVAPINGFFPNIVNSLKNRVNQVTDRTKHIGQKISSTVFSTAGKISEKIYSKTDSVVANVMEKTGIVDLVFGDFSFDQDQDQKIDEEHPLDFSYQGILDEIVEQTGEKVGVIKENIGVILGNVIFKDRYFEGDVNFDDPGEGNPDEVNPHPLTPQINTLSNIKNILTIAHEIVSNLKGYSPGTLRFFLKLLLHSPMKVVDSLCLTTRFGPKNVHSVMHGIRSAKKTLTTGNLAPLGRFLHEHTQDKEKLDQLVTVIVEQDNLLPLIMELLHKYCTVLEHERGQVENPQDEEERHETGVIITGTQQLVYLALIISLFYNFRDKEPIRSFITRVRSKLPDKKFVFRFPISFEGKNANPKAKK
jgi:predicted PurR-regulated permease PerM